MSLDTRTLSCPQLIVEIRGEVFLADLVFGFLPSL